MAFNFESITTGLLGYTRTKQLFSDSLPYRDLQVFTYELYSSDLSGLSPFKIQTDILNVFSAQYSGDINVKVFEVPNDFQFPSDSIRNSKFNVQVEVRTIPNLIGYPELSGAYYSGLDTGFINNYATYLVNFKEDFGFETSENGHQTFNHDVSFGLMSGGKNLATQIISGLYSNDNNTTFGISTMVGGISGANTGLVQNYFTESYDLIQNNFSFSKKREFLPFDASTFNYNLNHTMNLGENGVFDISEKCDLQAKINYNQAYQGLDLVYLGAYTRCSNYYNLLSSLALQPGMINNSFLAQLPKKIVKTYNQSTLMASYDVTFTTDPEFKNDGSSTEEVIEIQSSKINVIDISDKFSFTFNKRSTMFTGAANLITSAYNFSLNNISNYYMNSPFYNNNWLLNMIKLDTTWPSNKNKATLDIYYSNSPQNFVTINNVLFNTLTYNISNTKPVDIVNEYKIINRPNKLSVLNYAYATEKGGVSISFNAGIGRKTNEWFSGFRTDLQNYLNALYQYGITLFFNQFSNIFTVSFTYFLNDIKYTLNQDGTLNLQIEFNYTYKKYLF